MSIPTGQAIALVTGGMLIGAGVTTLVLKKHYEQVADARVETESAQIREYYRRKNAEVEIQEEFELNRLREEAKAKAENTPTPEEKTSPTTSRTAYNKIAVSEKARAELKETVKNLGYSTETGKEPETIDPRPDLPAADDVAGESYAYLKEDSEVNTPYIIPVDEFMANDNDFDNVTVTYYTGDNTFVDEADRVLDSVFETLGHFDPNSFGQESGDPNVVYVRNEMKELDIEVIKDFRAYGRDILGLQEVEERLSREPKLPRKFRDV